MIERIMIAGSGGQGTILIAKLLAHVALKHFEHITFFPAYGAEVRGGTSNGQVILSSDEIASPVPDQFDSLLIMNQASADKYLALRHHDGLVILNSSMCTSPVAPPMVAIRATEEADRLGDPRVANFIMLGAYIGAKRILPAAAVEDGIEQILAGKASTLINLNIRAFRFGMSGRPAGVV